LRHFVPLQNITDETPSNSERFITEHGLEHLVNTLRTFPVQILQSARVPARPAPSVLLREGGGRFCVLDRTPLPDPWHVDLRVWVGVGVCRCVGVYVCGVGGGFAGTMETP